MKSIKTKIIVTVILCSLVSTFICGAISIVNSVSTSYEDSQQEMQLKCVSQSDELDTMMQNVHSQWKWYTALQLPNWNMQHLSGQAGIMWILIQSRCFLS